MRNLRVVFAGLVILPVVACGGDNNSPDAAKPAIDAPRPIDAPKPIDAPSADAQKFDFSCAGSADPTTTDADTIVVSGTAETLSGLTPGAASDASVELLDGSGSGIQTITTGSDGTFTFTAVPTGGKALALSVSGTFTGDRPNIVIPHAALTADQPDVPVLLIPNGTFDTLASTFAHSTQTHDDGSGTFGFQVGDCAGTPVGNAAITVTEGGSDVGTLFDLATLSSSAVGTYFVFGVPPGTVTVNLTVEGQAFRTRTLTSVANTDVTTQLVP